MSKLTTVHAFTISNSEPTSYPPFVANEKSLAMSYEKSTIENRRTDVVPYNNSLVYEAFKPLLRSLLVAGFYHAEYRTDDGRWRLWLSRAYCWIVAAGFVAVLIVNILSLTATKKFDSDFFTLLTSIASYCLATLNAASFIVASHRRKALETFFTCFSRLDLYGGPYTAHSWLKTFLTICCAFCWISLVCSMAFVVFVMNQNLFSVTFGLNVHHSTALDVVSVIYMTYVVTCWIFISCMELSLAVVLYRELSLFARALKSKYVSSPAQSCCDMEVDRQAA